MKYYVDFDRTLFNTKEFLNDIYDILEEYQIPKNVFLQKAEEYDNFNCYKILLDLEKEISFDKSIYVEIDHLLEKTSVYVYFDALKFLTKVKKAGHTLIMLTKGDINFQNNKIDYSDIRKIFDKIIITNENKGDLDIDYNGIFIDDKLEEIESILKRKPIAVYLIDREHHYEKVEQPIHLIHSLNEIEIQENM